MTAEFSRLYICRKHEALDSLLKENNYSRRYFEGATDWILDSTGNKIGRVESNLPSVYVTVFNDKRGKKLMKLIEHADL